MPEANNNGKNMEIFYFKHPYKLQVQILKFVENGTVKKRSFYFEIL